MEKVRLEINSRDVFPHPPNGENSTNSNYKSAGIVFLFPCTLYSKFDFPDYSIREQKPEEDKRFEYNKCKKMPEGVKWAMG
jgi:hypothetical protein